MILFIRGLAYNGKKDDSLRQKNLGSSLPLQVSGMYAGSSLSVHVPFKVLCQELYAVKVTVQNSSRIITLMVLSCLFDFTKS